MSNFKITGYLGLAVLVCTTLAANAADVNNPGELNTALQNETGGGTINVNVADTGNVDATNANISISINAGGNATFNPKANNTPVNLNGAIITVGVGGILSGGAYNPVGLANSGTVNIGAGQQFAIDTLGGGGIFENQVGGSSVIFNLQGGVFSPLGLLFEQVNLGVGSIQINAASGIFVVGEKYTIAQATFAAPNGITTGGSLVQVGDVTFSIATENNGNDLVATVVNVAAPSLEEVLRNSLPSGAGDAQQAGSVFANALNTITNDPNSNLAVFVSLLSGVNFTNFSDEELLVFQTQLTASSQQMNSTSFFNNSRSVNNIVAARSSIEGVTNDTSVLGDGMPDFTNSKAFRASRQNNADSVVTKKFLIQEHKGVVRNKSGFLSFNDALDNMAEGNGPLTQQVGANRQGVWAQGYGNFMDKKSVGQFFGFKSKTGGVIFGFDTATIQSYLVGVALNISQTKVKVDNDGGDTKLRNFTVVFYGGKNFDAFFLDGSASIGYTKQRGNRRISLFNAAARNTHSSREMSARGEAGYKFKVLSKATLKPFSALSFAHIHNNGYRETGNTGFDLNVGSQDTMARTLEIGAKADTVVDLFGTKIVPWVKLSWLNKKASGSGVTSHFIAAPAAGSFKSSVDKKTQNLISSSIASTAYLSKDLTITAYYSGEFNNKISGHQFGGRLRMTV